MNKAIPAVAAGLMALGLTACAAPAPAAPLPTATVTSGPEVSPAPKGGDDLFYALMEIHPESLASADTRFAAKTLGKAGCTALDAGLSWSIIVAQVPNDKYTEIQVDTLAAGVAAYCPEYINEIER